MALAFVKKARFSADERVEQFHKLYTPPTSQRLYRSREQFKRAADAVDRKLAQKIDSSCPFDLGGCTARVHPCTY